MVNSLDVLKAAVDNIFVGDTTGVVDVIDELPPLEFGKLLSNGDRRFADNPKLIVYMYLFHRGVFFDDFQYSAHVIMNLMSYSIVKSVELPEMFSSSCLNGMISPDEFSKRVTFRLYESAIDNYIDVFVRFPDEFLFYHPIGLELLRCSGHTNPWKSKVHGLAYLSLGKKCRINFADIDWRIEMIKATSQGTFQLIKEVLELEDEITL